MILVCPNCSTRYSVADTAFSAAGRQVKCTRCAHKWWQTPVDDESEVAEAAPPDFSAQLVEAGTSGATEPAARRFGRSPGASKTTRRIGGQAVGWAGLALFLAVIAAGLLLGGDRIQASWPAASRLYEALGLPVRPVATGLAFRNVAPDWQKGDGGSSLVITGEIENISGQPVSVPPIRVVLRDAKDADVQSETVPSEVTELDPGEAAPFRLRLERPSAEAAGVALFFAPAG